MRVSSQLRVSGSNCGGRCCAPAADPASTADRLPENPRHIHCDVSDVKFQSKGAFAPEMVIRLQCNGQRRRTMKTSKSLGGMTTVVDAQVYRTF